MSQHRAGDSRSVHACARLELHMLEIQMHLRQLSLFWSASSGLHKVFTLLGDINMDKARKYRIRMVQPICGSTAGTQQQ